MKKLRIANYKFPRVLDIIDEFEYELTNHPNSKIYATDDETQKHTAFCNFVRQQLCSKLV